MKKPSIKSLLKKINNLRNNNDLLSSKLSEMRLILIQLQDRVMWTLSNPLTILSHLDRNQLTEMARLVDNFDTKSLKTMPKIRVNKVKK